MHSTISDPTAAADASIKARQNWMRLLALISLENLETAWTGLPSRPLYQILRGPEIGLAMVRARAGGTGGQFNLGEMTITRCSIRTEAGYNGHAYIIGRSPKKAELAAVLDAMLQDPDWNALIRSNVLNPLELKLAEEDEQAARKTAATKVNFFTMVRGDE